MWSVESGEQKLEMNSRLAQIGALEFLDGNLLSMTGVYGGLVVVDTDNQFERCRIVTHDFSTGRLAAVPAAERLVVGSGDGSLEILDTKQILEPHVFWHGTHVWNAAFLPETESILSADGAGLLRRWNLKDGTSDVVLDTGLKDTNGASLRSATLHPNGSVMAFVGAASAIQLVDINTGDVRPRFLFPTVRLRVFASRRMGSS